VGTYEHVPTEELEKIRMQMSSRIRELEEELEPLKEARSTIAYVLFRRSYKVAPVQKCRPYLPSRIRREREEFRKEKTYGEKYRYTKDFIREFLSWPQERKEQFLRERDGK